MVDDVLELAEITNEIVRSNGLNYKIYSYFKDNPDRMTPEITQLMVNNLKPGKYVEASTIVSLTPYLNMENISAIGEHIITTDVSNEAYNFLNTLDGNYEGVILSMKQELLRRLIDNDMRGIDYSSSTMHAEIIEWFNIDGVSKYVLEYLIIHGIIDKFVNAINKDYRMNNGILNVPIIFNRLDDDPLTVAELLDYYNISKDTQLGVII